MCDDEVFDVWTLCHLVVSAVIGFASRALCIGYKWLVCVFLLVLWELFELTGRELGWTFVPAWFECESVLNVAVDIGVGVVGVAFGMKLHQRMREC